MTKNRNGQLTRTEFRAEIREWAQRIGASPKRVQIREMTMEWASCSTEGRLTFSEDLLKEPKAFRDVVVVHEIIHLLVPNHGKLFKAMMSAYVPDWGEVSGTRVVRMCRYE